MRAAVAAVLGGFAAVAIGSYAWLSGSPPPAAPAAAAATVQLSAPVELPVPPQPAAPPPVSADGLILYGISGTSREGTAIIGSRLGGQRVVAVGDDYRPGLRLAEVGIDHAVLRNAGGDIRLELSRFAAGGSPKAAASLPAEEEQKLEAAVLRNILKPVMANGRVGGYALRPGESLPQLVRAGLRPGDVIMSVNGSQLDEERMSELAWQMGNAQKTDFVFVRNGKKMRATL